MRDAEAAVDVEDVPGAEGAERSVGERLREGQDGVYEALGVRVSREFRPTKEYPRGQEVYALTFEQDGSELETSDEDAEVGTDVVDVSDATGGGDGKAS